MKKTIFTAAIFAAVVLAVTGCDNGSGTGSAGGPSVDSVDVATLTVSSGATRSVASADDLKSVFTNAQTNNDGITTMKNADIVSKLTSSFTSLSTASTTVSGNSNVNQLSETSSGTSGSVSFTDEINELVKGMNAVSESVSKNGSGSYSYSKNWGEIDTGITGATVKVPVVKFNMSEKSSSVGMASSLSASAAASGTLDMAEYLAAYNKANSTSETSVIKYAALNFAAEITSSGASTVTSTVTTSQVKTNESVAASAGVVFADSATGMGGKLIIDALSVFDTTTTTTIDMEKMQASSGTSSTDYQTTTTTGNKEPSKFTVKISVYDDDGTLTYSASYDSLSAFTEALGISL